MFVIFFFFFSSRRRHTRYWRDWSSDVCSSDLVVYKARDTELDRFVALKFLPPYLASDSVEKERFYHEARAASALNHPNIATIHDIKEFADRLYLAMEFIDGKTLKATAAQESLSIQKVLDIAIPVCDGVAS